MIYDNEKFLYSIEQMRIQRHDFMNYLQVIYGYLQINKPSEAIKFIKDINSKMLVQGNVYNLNSPEFGLVMQEFLANCSKNGIEIEFYTELEYISCDIFSKNIDIVRNLFNYIIEIISGSKFESIDGKQKLHLNIYEINDEFVFIIGISSEIIDTIDEKGYCGNAEPLPLNNWKNIYINLYKSNGYLEAIEIKIKENDCDW